MWSDILTKPKQGAGFRRDRAYLMNVPEDYDDDVERAKTNEKVLGRHTDIPGPVQSTIRPMTAKSNILPPHHCRSVLEGEPGTGRSMRHISDMAQKGHSTGEKLASFGWNKARTHMKVITVA